MSSAGFMKFLRSLFVNEQKALKNWQESLIKKKTASCQSCQIDDEKSKITLGFYDENETKPYSLDKNIVAGKSHYFLSGTTGSGKSFWLLSFILYLLSLVSLQHYKISLIIIDLKGELLELLTSKILPAFLINLTEKEQEEFFLNYHYLNPFKEEGLFPFNILKQIPEIPIAIQGQEISSLIEESVGADLGICQKMTLQNLLILSVEQGLKFPQILKILNDPYFRGELLSKTKLEDVKEYFLFRFEKEDSTSLNGLINRLQLFCLLPSVKTMLNASDCLNFYNLFDSGLTLINLGEIPLGAEKIQKFIATLIMTRLARAVLSRKVKEQSPPCLIICDEFQEALTQSLGLSFERLLSLSRSKRVFFALCTQLLSNVEQFSSHLPKVIQTNTHLQLYFKNSFEEAKKLSLLLPVTGKKIDKQAIMWGKKKNEIYLSESEERNLLLKELATLPTRHFYLFNRHQNQGLIHLVAPKVEISKKESTGSTEIKERLMTNPWAKSISRENPEQAEERCENKNPENIILEHFSRKTDKGINLG